MGETLVELKGKGSKAYLRIQYTCVLCGHTHLWTERGSLMQWRRKDVECRNCGGYYELGNPYFDQIQKGGPNG